QWQNATTPTPRCTSAGGSCEARESAPCRRQNQIAVVARIDTRPLAERLVERADIGKPKALGDFPIADGGIGQPLGGHFLAQAILDRLIRLPRLRQPATER